MRLSARHRSLVACPRRRGSILVALVVALIVLSLIVIGVSLAGARDLDLTVHRAQWSQAQLAATAAADMAVKELYDNVDEDGDGTIGTISGGTGGSGNPVINGASFYASKSVSGSTTTVTATGTGGNSTAVVQVTLSGAGASGNSSRAFMAQGSNASVYQSVQTGGSWPTPAVSGSTYDIPAWIVAQPMPSPNVGKSIVATMDESSNLNIGLAAVNGTASYTDVCSNLVGINSRAFDVGVDVPDSKAVIVYWDGNNNVARYYTHNGTTLAGPTNIGLSLVSGGDYGQVFKLATTGTTSTISLLLGTQNGYLLASQWTGSGWSSQSTLSTNLPVSGTQMYYQTFGSALETQTGRIIAVYADASNNTYYRIYSSGSWGSQATLSGLSTPLNWVRLASCPGTNQIYFAGLDTSNNAWAAQWSGSAWSTPVKIASSTGYADRQMVDVACSSDASTILVAYGDNANTIFYRTWTGSAWSSQQTGPNLGSSVYIVSLNPGPATSQITCAASTGASALYSAVWNGSSFSSAQTIQSNLSGYDQFQRFSVVPGSGSLTITGWTRVLP